MICVIYQVYLLYTLSEQYICGDCELWRFDPNISSIDRIRPMSKLKDAQYIEPINVR